jgi:hypothetical protein
MQGHFVRYCAPPFGSQIRSVLLMHVDDAFLSGLKGAAHRVRLQELGWTVVSTATGKALAKCLPALVSLRTLRVASVALDAALWFLKGLAMNESLEHVVTANLGFDATQLHRVEAAGHRNKRGPTLLETEPCQPFHDDDDDDDDGAFLVDHAANMDVSAFPALLECAKPIKHSGITLLLSGLLTLGKCKYKESGRHSE